MPEFEEVRRKFKQDRFATDRTGIVIDSVGDKYSKCSFEVCENHLNAMNSVMGGAIFTLADYTFAVAANSDGRNIVSVSSTVNFLRPGICSKLIAEARCIKDGKSTCFYEVTVCDEAGKQIAAVSFTGYVIK
ncbi:MAG: PaaI family thioesterase [Clostridia bacterium]|nr:PaaI family thioesterase [Clostridia bacterium]